MDQERALAIMRGMAETLYYVMNESRLDGWDDDLTLTLYELSEAMESAVRQLKAIAGH